MENEEAFLAALYKFMWEWGLTEVVIDNFWFVLSPQYNFKWGKEGQNKA